MGSAEGIRWARPIGGTLSKQYPLIALVSWFVDAGVCLCFWFVNFVRNANVPWSNLASVQRFASHQLLPFSLSAKETTQLTQLGVQVFVCVPLQQQGLSLEVYIAGLVVVSTAGREQYQWYMGI